MSDAPIAPPAPPLIIGGLDCSPEAQALRWQRIRELEGNFYSGATQVTDRGRSVSFASRHDMGAAIRALRNEVNVCMGFGWPRRGTRVFYVPQVKDL